MTMQILGWSIIHSLWEGGLIAAAVTAVFALTSRRQAAGRYLVGLAGLLLMIVAPIVTAARSVGDTAILHSASLPGRPVSSPATPFAGSDISSPETQLLRADISSASTSSALIVDDQRGVAWPILVIRQTIGNLDGVLPWLVLAWMIGLLIAAGRLAGGLQRTRRLISEETAPAEKHLLDMVGSIARKIGIDREITVVQSATIRVPLVVGAFKSAMIIPVTLITGLAPWQLEMLVAHELAHIRRLDFLVNLVQTVIETLLFYHPGARWLSERIRDERENCCDDIAIAVCGGDPREYTRTLLALEESRGLELGLAAAASGGSLLRRARRLLEHEQAHVDLGPRWVAGIITIAAVLLTGREAMGSAIKASFNPATAFIRAPEKSDSSWKKSAQWPDPSRAKPEAVLRSPAGSLSERWRWAERNAGPMRAYWIGYLVAGDPDGQSRFYADPVTPVHVGATTTMTGSMELKGNETEGVIFSGALLAPIVGTHAPGSTAIFLHFTRTSASGTQLDRVHVGTFMFPVHFDRAPLLWLDSASDGESVALLRGLASQVKSADAKGDLVGAVGVHQDRNLVVPALIQWLQSNESTDIRREAADHLGRYGDSRAMSALSHAVRTDQSEDVRRASIEAFARMKGESAADSLVVFVETLRSYDDRRTAIESIGTRGGERAVASLNRIAKASLETRIRGDAVEALGTMPDGEGLSSVLDVVRNDPSAELRRKAVESLAQLKPANKALDLLADIARTDRDESVRRGAIESIANIHDDRALPLLRELATRQGEIETQLVAIEALSQTSQPAAALGVLNSIARNNAARLDVRKRAIETLSEIRDEPASLRSLLEMARANESEELRDAAIQGLADTHQPQAYAALEAIARGRESYDLRRKAMEAITDNYEEAKAITFLKSFLNDPDTGIRMHALEALGDLHGAGGMATVKEIARSSQDQALKRKAQSILDDR